MDSTLKNIRKPPDSYVWGEAKRNIFNNTGAVAIRGDMNVNDHDVMNIDMRVNAFLNNLGVRLLGAAGTYIVAIHG